MRTNKVLLFDFLVVRVGYVETTIEIEINVFHVLHAFWPFTYQLFVRALFENYLHVKMQ